MSTLSFDEKSECVLEQLLSRPRSVLSRRSPVLSIGPGRRDLVGGPSPTLYRTREGWRRTPEGVTETNFSVSFFQTHNDQGPVDSETVPTPGDDVPSRTKTSRPRQFSSSDPGPP